MAEVRGEFKDGTAVDTNIEYPVLIGGKDGSGNAQTLLMTTTGALTSGGATHDSAVIADGPQGIIEYKDFDGSALPNNVGTEGDAVRTAGSAYGIQYIMQVSEDGSQSPYDSINNALNVQEIAPALDRYQTVEIQAATTITAAETAIGGEINVSQYNTITTYIDYTLGDETSYDIIFKFLRVAGGDEHPFNTFSAGATKTVTAEKFQFTASGKHYITLDVTGLSIIKIFGDATGGTPNGTSQISYTISNN